MNRGKYHWWPFYRGTNRRLQEPSDALFQGLRVRLTLWYCGVLGTALVLFCVALYVVAQFALFNPVEHRVTSDAYGHAQRWFTDGPTQACSDMGGTPEQSGAPATTSPPRLLTCFNQNGTLVQGTRGTYPSATPLPNTLVQRGYAALTSSLVQRALQNGSAHDTINGGSVGAIYCYAVAVRSPTGSGYTGVVVSGEGVQTQNTLLSTLLILLLSIGGVTLLGAGLGGLFLAHRALAPAHLAFTRQQRFIADASHELRTPLTLMRADAEVLLRGRDRMAAEDVALLEDIVAEANHMSVLANSMLMLARLDASAQHHEQEIVSLDALTSRGVQRVMAFAEQKGIVVQRETIDNAFVVGDPMLLEQALLIVLDNAIKYNRPEGQVTVRTSVSDGQARLAVTDTGIGIAVEHLPHLGERFYRVDKARSREGGGTGLGLSIARRIIVAHAGQLTLDSTPEQGTTVTLILPLAAVTLAAEDREKRGSIILQK